MTFGFIASFATARVRRLGLAQAAVALAAGLVVVQTIRHSWLPAWESVIHQLPAGAELRNGRLDWPANSPARLAESSFITVDVDVEQTGSFTHSADFGIEFSARSVKIYSFLGFLELPYPANETLALNRSSVDVRLWHELKEVRGGNCLDRAVLLNNQTKEETEIEVDTVLLNLGFSTDIGPIREWGLDMNVRDIKVNNFMETNLPGVYAAGDIAAFPGKLKLIATGVGEICIAVNYAKMRIDPGSKAFPGHSSNMSL